VTRSRSLGSTSRLPPGRSDASSRTSGARASSQTRAGERLRREQLAQGFQRCLDGESVRADRGGAVQDLNLVLKGDVVGSVEAAVSSSARSSIQRCA